MNILLIGSGGREHALAWKLQQSSRLQNLYVAPGNAGTQQYNIADTDLILFAKQNNIDRVLIGPEAPLAAGLGDEFTEAGFAVWGPTQRAAEIESSKAFSKAFMVRHKIPTARFEVFTDADTAIKYLNNINYPVVIKASGLAAGKGVILPNSPTDAETAIHALLKNHAEIIIEERLTGPEISLLGFSNGMTIKSMPLARDHKRLGDNDTGPNTGGMGAYAPVACDYSTELLTQQFLQSAIDGLRAEGRPFIGVLYAGLMLTPEGPRALEYNCRFGDPETQVLLPLLKTDFLDIIDASLNQTLKNINIEWHDQHAACVVLAAKGYPDKPVMGTKIMGEACLAPTVSVEIFHAGTAMKNNQIVTNGGRVLGVTGMGSSLTEALKMAYETIDSVKFEGMQYRKDIGVKSVSYADAGVDITAGQEAIELMSSAVKSTYGSEVLAGIGAFGGMYSAMALKDMKHPVLVASTDGVGTKVHLAVQHNRFRSIGHDIVNHSINDILVQGARPLFFMDYLASSKLDPKTIAEVVSGMAEACKTAGCALLGGETAEMPGVYQPGMLDVAGTIVGLVEQDAALPKKNIQAGDVLIGIASSGPHTNGYSLIRKVFENTELTPELIDALLAPHRSYLPILKPIIDSENSPIKGLVHITGGGFSENIPRILPKNITAKIDYQSWPIPTLFQLIQKTGRIPDDEMFRVFNMGIGMVMITAPENVGRLQKLIPEKTWVIGALS